MARIALVHDVAGIAEVQAQLLRTAGHEVDEIALPVIGATWRWPTKAVALPIRLAAYLPAAMRLRRGKYDVVHVHWLTHGIVGVLARRPFFAQAHGSDLHLNLNNPVYRLVTRRVLRSATKVFYVTPNLRTFLKEVDGKLLYLPNPVDMRGVGQPYPPPTQVSKVVVFTRLDPVKGVDRIFPAVERLSGRVDVTAFEWGSLARDYVKRYKRWVNFVKPVPHTDVGAFLSQFDLAIGQMKQGILSLMEIEALAAGRPLITAIDWSLYQDDPPPVIAASGPDEIVAAVDALRSSPDRLADLSRNGRDWALRNHSYAHHLELLQAAYFGSPAPEPAVSTPAPR
jgi:glycosyltransferase involved in cell wall biosynthesis